MIQFSKKHSGADVTIFSVMSALANEHAAINLSQGFPDYPIDSQLQYYLQDALAKGFNQYAPMAGLPMLQSAIAQQQSLKLGHNISPDEVTIFPGASYAIYGALCARLQKGDEVVIFEPAYDAYIPAIEMNGGVVVTVPLQYPDFSVDWSKFQDVLTDRTKAIIVNTPHNPTGVIWSKEDWAQLARFVSGKDILIISDEVYDEIVYDGNLHHSVLQESSLKEQAIAVYSFGKQLHATGWKIGYSIAAPSISKAIRRVHQFIGFSVNTPAQYAIAHFLAQHDFSQNAVFLQEKRNLLNELIAQTPLCLGPISKGSYFQIVDYRRWKQMSDIEFATWMTKEVGVATIPLSAFYKDKTDNGLVRFCFAKEEKTLIQAFERIQNFLKK
jgi:methionine aminotransferase